MSMATKPNRKIFHVNALVNGRLIAGTVVFSPAPQDGILTELARTEAERLLAELANTDISAGRL